jgi:molybdopterin synthase catalytic subunit
MARILYFGVARDLAGTDQEELMVGGVGTVDSVWAQLVAVHPKLAPIRSICRVAVDMHYATGETPVAESAEIAIIPPVAGG